MSDLVVSHRREDGGWVLAPGMSSCVVCDEVFPDDLVVGVPGREGVVCDSCLVYCEWCDSPSHPDDLVTRGVLARSVELCSGCADLASTCENCGTVFDYSEEGGTVWPREYTYCGRCLDDVSYCETCDRHTTDGVCGDCLSCESCGCDCSDSCGRLLAWDAKPRPVFHSHDHDRTMVPDSGRVYFGWELEVENRGDDSISDLVELVSDTLGDLAYCKHDGSLHNGFEIVSHPMTAEYFDRLSLFDSLLRGLGDRGCRSWMGHRCGFHVHLSRDGFVSRSHLFAFSLFWYRNRDEISRLSGRNPEEMERWASLSAHQGDGHGSWPTLLDKVTGRSASTRYAAVNLTNEDTIEVRVFRGSLIPTTIRGYFDLVWAAFLYTASLTSREIRAGHLSWDAFTRSADPTSFPHLHSLIKKRGF